jgi:hypothetical protein
MSYLQKGGYKDFTNLPEGYYKVLVVGGSYNWDFYTGSDKVTTFDGVSNTESAVINTIGGVSINRRRITYDIGDIFISKKTRKSISFDPYNPSVPDRDMPTGYVTVKFTHGGGVVQGGDSSGNISRIQFVSGAFAGAGIPNYPANSKVYGIGTIDPTTRVQFQTSSTDCDAPVDRKHIIAELSGVIHPGDPVMSFYLPPTIMGMRAWDLGHNDQEWQGGGERGAATNDRGRGAPARNWSKHYLDLDLRGMAGKEVFVVYYYGSPANTGPLRISSDMYQQNGAVVNLTDLSDYIHEPAAGRSLNMTYYDESAGTPFRYNAVDSPQYTGAVRWFKVSNMTDAVPSAASEMKSSDEFAANQRYRAVVSLIAKNGFVFPGSLAANAFTYTGSYSGKTYSHTAATGTNFEYNNANAMGRITNPAVSSFGSNGASMVINFIKTPAAPGADANLTVLTAAHLPVPSAGSAPPARLVTGNGDHFTGVVQWFLINEGAGYTSAAFDDRTGGTPLGAGDIFISGKIYRAEIWLQPKPASPANTTPWYLDAPTTKSIAYNGYPNNLSDFAAIQGNPGISHGRIVNGTTKGPHTDSSRQSVRVLIWAYVP